MSRTTVSLALLALGAVTLIIGLGFASPVVAAIGGLLGGGGFGYLLPRRPAGQKETANPRVAAPADLNDLELKAKVKGDFEVARLLDRIEKIGPRLEATLADAHTDAADVGGKLRRIHDVSIVTLRDAFDLHLAAREMATAGARDEVLEQRSLLVAEASDAIDALDRGIDRLRASAATSAAGSRAGELADFSSDLDRQLEVARRVEQRMRDLEARARGGHLAEHEAYVTGGGA